MRIKILHEVLHLAKLHFKRNSNFGVNDLEDIIEKVENESEESGQLDPIVSCEHRNISEKERQRLIDSGDMKHYLDIINEKNKEIGKLKEILREHGFWKCQKCRNYNPKGYICTECRHDPNL